MPQPKLTGLLVGAHFRPPAKTLLSSLTNGTSLELRPEPDNPYDPQAIQVWLTSTDFIRGLDEAKLLALAEALASQGFTPEDLETQPEWHLGYIARDGNKDLAKVPGTRGNSAFQGQTEATLQWGPNGEALLVCQ